MASPVRAGMAGPRAAVLIAAAASVAALLACLALAPTAAAQSSGAIAAARARAKSNATTTIDQPGARLFVPAGAVADGAMIGFGLGGVPGRDRLPDRPGAIVTAAGGLLGPVVVLFRPTLAAATPGTGAFALLDTASAERTACQANTTWVACTVPRAGAYILDRGPPAAATDPLLLEALGQPPTRARASTNSEVVRAALVIALVAGAGGVLATLARRRANA